MSNNNFKSLEGKELEYIRTFTDSFNDSSENDSLLRNGLEIT